jgi:MATE family, multidrug efflux pump
MIDMAAGQSASREAWRSEIRATASLAWPLILTNLAQVALGLTDVIMMGWLGPEALAAGALATNLNFAFLIFAIGLVTATSPMIAIELGRRRHSVREVRRTVRQGLWVAVTITLPIWVILWQGEWILRHLGQDPEISRQAARYLRALQWAFLPFLFYIVLRNFVAALERPLSAFWVGAAAIVVNALLVWSLMFGKFGLPALGLLGAGIGTSTTGLFMFVGLAVLVSLDRRFRRYRLFGRFWRSDWPRFREVWRLGLPIAFTIAFEVTIFNAAAILMGLISPEALAAHAIAIQIPSFAFMVPLGLGMAATVRVGLSFGAGNPAAITRAGWSAFTMAMVYSCFTAAIMLLFGRQLVGVFLDFDTPANLAVIDLAVSFLVFAGFFQIFDGAQALGSGMLRGLGDTRVPMIFAAIGYWGVGMPLGIVLAFWAGFEGSGIWIGLSAGLAIVAVLMMSRWIMRQRLGLLRPSAAPDRSRLMAEVAAEPPGVAPGPIL